MPVTRDVIARIRIVHCCGPGKQHANADTMSQHPCGHSVSEGGSPFVGDRMLGKRRPLHLELTVQTSNIMSLKQRS